MAIKIPTMVSTLATSEVTFCETAWLMASISLVRRLIKLAGRIGIEKANRKPLQVLEQVAAQFFQGLLRNTRHDPVGDGLENIVQDVEAAASAGPPYQAGRVFTADELIDGYPHQVRADQTQQGVEQHADHATIINDDL